MFDVSYLGDPLPESGSVKSGLTFDRSKLVAHTYL